MNGRDTELMDGILEDARTAVYGLPVVFYVVPFDTPILSVYISGENTGSIMWMTDDLDGVEGHAWWSVSTITMNISRHGDSLREAIARHLNEYIDKRVGLT